MWILPHKSFIIIEEFEPLTEQEEKVSFVNNYNNDVLHEYCNLIS